MAKAFDKVQEKVMEWAMRKKGIPEALVRAVMSLYESAKTKVNVGTRLSEELDVNVGVHQGSALPPLLFAIEIDVVTIKVKVGTLQEILYVDDLVFDSGDNGGTAYRINTYIGALLSKGLKVNLLKTRITVSKIGQINIRTSSEKDPCGICGRRKMANVVL